ncbi:hypothetical protein YC2023_065989 [Brassica napus]
MTLPVDCSGDFGPRGLSVQYTQDVRRCPQEHTGRPWLSVCVCQHTQNVRGCPSVHISARWSLDSTRWPFPWTVRVILAHVGCLFSTHRTSVGVCQHTQDVRGCPLAHTRRPWLSVCVRVCPSAHTGRPWLSISTHISTLVLGLSMLTLPVDCLGDFGPGGLLVQYTQDVRGCPPAHTGRLWLSVCYRQHTHDVRGCPSVHISARCTHRMSVGVRQHTQDVRGCPCVSVCVRVCPLAHTGRSWLSISTHISTLVLGLSMPTLPVDCSGDFGPCELSVQYTQNVRGCPCVSVCVLHTDFRGCPSAHTRRSWVSISTNRTSVAVRVCLCVTVSTHRTFVALHQYTYQHYTQDVRGCPPAHTGRLWVSVCVRVCLLAHTRRPWLSNSTHISTLVLGLSTLSLPVDCSGDFGPRGLSVQYTQDVRGCPCVSVSTHRTSVAVRVCLCESVSTHRMSVAVHQYTYQHVGPWTQHANPSHGLFR